MQIAAKLTHVSALSQGPDLELVFNFCICMTGACQLVVLQQNPSAWQETSDGVIQFLAWSSAVQRVAFLTVYCG